MITKLFFANFGVFMLGKVPIFDQQFSFNKCL